MTHKTVPSPCIGVCVMDPDSGYCRGCLRTLGEIAGWPEYDDGRRLQIIDALKQRAVPTSPRA